MSKDKDLDEVKDRLKKRKKARTRGRRKRLEKWKIGSSNFP